MKGTFLKTELKNIMERVNDIIEKSASSPALQNVYIRFDEEGASFIGTDTKIQINARLEGSIEAPGEITVNAAEFFNIIRNLADEEINLFQNGTELEIVTDTSDFALPSIDIDEFVFLSFDQPDGEFFLKAQDLHNGLKHISGLAAQHARLTNQQNLVGVLLERDTDSFLVGATDTNVLGFIEYQTEDTLEISSKLRFVLPLKVAKSIEKVLSSAKEEQVVIKFKENRLQIEYGRYSYILTLLDSNFIDVKALFNKDFSIELKLPTHNFINTLRPVISVIDPDFSCLHFTFDGNEELKVKAYNSPIKAEVQQQIADSNKEGFDIYVHAGNLMRIINNIQTEFVTLQMPVDACPVYLKPANLPEGVTEKFILSVVTFK